MAGDAQHAPDRVALVERALLLDAGGVGGEQAGDDQGFVLGVMMVFLFFVTVTLPYELKKGVLKWV